MLTTFRNHFVHYCIKHPAFIGMLVAKVAVQTGSHKLNPRTNMTVALALNRKYKLM